MDEMCRKCKNKTIGCSKFCSSYKRSYDSFINNTKQLMRVRLREQEIYNKLRRDMRYESK